MSRNYKFYFDPSGKPCARGPAAEKALMTFLEVDVQGSDYICRDLMDDLTAIEDESDDSREFIGNAHHIVIASAGVVISSNQTTEDIDNNLPFEVGLKRFREVLEDWEAFILDDQIDESLSEDDYL